MLPTDIVTAARDLYNATSDTFYSDTQIYNWMWWAEHELAKQAWCIEAISSGSTVASTQSYAFPTNAIAVKRVTVNGRKLQPVTMREDDAVTLSNQAATTTGAPLYYTEFNSTIYMRPIPDAVYTISWYTYNDATLPSATGTLDVPALFHLDLVDYILYRMFAKDKDVANLTLHKQLWDAHVVDAIAYMKRKRRTDSFKTVQSEDNLPVTILGAV